MKRNRGKNQPQYRDDGLDHHTQNSMAQLYLLYLERLAVLNYSKRTIRSHRENIIRFLQWAQERDLVLPQTITKPILESYQRSLYRYQKDDGSGLSFRTQTTHLVTIKNFFKWLCRNDYILSNPASELEMPRKEKHLPQVVLTAEEVEQIMTLPCTITPLGLRDRAILETFYSTAMRRSELAGLSLEDLDHKREIILIRQGKGKKDRYVPIGKRALHWVQRYLKESRPKLSLSLHQHALFLTGYGDSIRPDTLTRLATSYIKKAKLGKTGSCHLLRHTCATLMLEAGADLRYVQQLLGHEDISTTTIYTHIAIKQLQEIHRKTHPAEG